MCKIRACFFYSTRSQVNTRGLPIVHMFGHREILQCESLNKSDLGEINLLHNSNAQFIRAYLSLNALEIK